MSPVVVQEFVTLDGVVQDPGKEREFEHANWRIPFIERIKIVGIAAHPSRARAALSAVCRSMNTPHP